MGRWTFIGIGGACAVAGFAFLPCCRAEQQRRETSGDMIKVTVKADELDKSGIQKLAITITPKKGCFVFANPVGNKLFETSATRISFRGKATPKILKIEFPKGTLVKDEIVGDYWIYSKPETIQVWIRRTNKAPFNLGVSVQATRRPHQG